MEKNSFKPGHEKSRIGVISFLMFVLKTTSMYFDLTYYYYCYTKLTFLTGCAHENEEN